jgi:hypothetical protein
MQDVFKVAVLLSVLVLSGCAAPPPKDYTAFRATNPRSIVVVPVTNKSTQVEAPDNFLVTLPIPLAERGYYVFPVNMVKRVMEDDGLSDADLVHAADARRLAGLFSADAVLLAEIVRWDSKYILISTTTTVSIRYSLKSGKTGETIWEQEVTTEYTPGASHSGNPLVDILATAIAAAIERAMPSYIPLATQANVLAVYTEGQGIPPGPYDAKYAK